MGTTRFEGDALVLEGLATEGALVSHTIELRAESRSHLRYRFEGLQPGLQVKFFWRTATTGAKCLRHPARKRRPCRHCQSGRTTRLARHHNGYCPIRNGRSARSGPRHPGYILDPYTCRACSQRSSASGQASGAGPGIHQCPGGYTRRASGGNAFTHGGRGRMAGLALVFLLGSGVSWAGNTRSATAL